MRKTRILNILVLAVLFCSVLSIGMRSTPVLAQSPTSILVYTQYADTDTGGEFANTMDAINDTYGALGTAFTYENLTDYTALATEIEGHNVLLVVEQEDVTTTGQMTTVGTAWNTTLRSFAFQGGVIIVLDYGGSFYGPAIHLLNATGMLLFQTSVGWANHNYATLNTVNIVNSTDSLASGVPSSMTATDGTMSVYTNEGVVVAEDNTGHAVVIHKRWGLGHIVYCGFDFFNPNSNYARILSNAVGLTPELPPGIPGFPVEAIAIALVSCLGLGIIVRRRREVN